MARNDYLNEPVRMQALASWSGQEGKVKRGQQITVTERRARELEGYQRTQSPRLALDGTRTPAGQPFKGRARAVRIHEADSKGESKGGPTVRDKAGRNEKGQPPEQTEEKDRGSEAESNQQQNSSAGASAAAQARAEELGISLERVQGSGAHGRITKPDVEAAAERLKQEQAPPRTGDAQLDRFTADLRECSYAQLYEQRELYESEEDSRYLQAIDAEIKRRDGAE